MKMIGGPLSTGRWISAPMVNQSDCPWRMLLRRYGGELVYTQMIESERFVQDEKYREEIFITCPEDRPLIVQFSGSNPDLFTRACKLVEPYCDGIDLNLGCPQRAARTGCYGAYLLEPEHHSTIFKMIESVRSSGFRIPICAKIRLLPTLGESIEFCLKLSRLVDVLTIHGRTRGFVEERRKGPADLKQIQQIITAIRRDEQQRKLATTPIISTQLSSSPTSITSSCPTSSSCEDDASAATLSCPISTSRSASGCRIWTNGNVRCETDVEANIAFTGADGCMVGEALLNDPTLFSRCQTATRPTTASSFTDSSSNRPYVTDSLLTLSELDHKLRIMNEYIEMIQQPSYPYYSPFSTSPLLSTTAATPISTSASPDQPSGPIPMLIEPSTASAPTALRRSPETTSSSRSSPFLATSCVTDDTFRTPLVSWSSFHLHLYHLLNSDQRARFLYHTQLVDDFLDATTIGEIRRVCAQVRDCIVHHRPFDFQLQSQIDRERSQRQQKRAGQERQRARQEVVARGGLKQLNSRERKRERWKQRKLAKQSLGDENEEEEAGERKKRKLAAEEPQQLRMIVQGEEADKLDEKKQNESRE